MSSTLLYINSGYIKDYIRDNPIDWHKRNMAKRGGPGDMIGLTPTPAVLEFIKLLHETKDLFTQRMYMNHCWYTWADWVKTKPMIQKIGLKARLYRNFYPSMIDSLHLWAMLSESGHFSKCVLDAHDDAVSKTDLTIYKDNIPIRLALIGPTTNCRNDRAYKIQNRDSANSMSCIVVQMPMTQVKGTGNKRWYTEDTVQWIVKQTESQCVKMT